MEQQWNRMQAIKMSRRGYPAREIAEFFGVSIRAVYGWLSMFASFGQDGLLARKGAGRPPKLDAEQMRWIARTVAENTPDQLKFAFGLWTLRLIGELIERQFEMRLSLPTLGKVMALLGFSPQRPLHRAWEQDATLVRAWLNTDLPALRRRAKAKGARILFADEASMRTDYHAGTTWAPQGQTPVVKATGTRTSVNMISAVSSTGELQFMLVEGRSTAEVFKRFLEQLMLAAPGPIILVVDGHSIHKARLVKQYVDSTAGKLELCYLPPYSPQLNPDEQVWKNVKERVAKQFPKGQSELRDMLVAALERLRQLPELV
ncbi:MAG: IS630 family transposase, partial [Proteobacteria bacterium]|nr:IS630 family transposase [Pseudomonadota bacterium]